MRALRPLLVACALALWAAAHAHADFVPSLQVGLDPPTAAMPAALTTTIAQPPLDTAVERFTLALPAGFTALAAPEASACSLPAIRAASCPAASQIGTVNALVGAAVGFSGTIHKASADKFVLIVSGINGSIKQVVAGSVAKRADGSLDLTLDNLPALALSSLTLSFDGAGRSLVRTPEKCGSYAIDGKFTSRHDELALARTMVDITGCSGVPAIGVTNLRMSRNRFKVGRQTIIAWSATRAADHTDVRVERRVKGRWKVVGVLVATAKAGENVLRWGGLVGERPLKPGRYVLRIQPAGSAPAKPPLPFEILR